MHRRPMTLMLALLLTAAACGDAAETAATTAPSVAPSAAVASTTTAAATTATPATTTEPPTTTTTVATTTTTLAPTTTTTTAPPVRDDVATFFAGALAVCNSYSVETNGFAPFDGSGADPTVGVTFDEVTPGLYRIVDRDGVELLVDFANRVVTGVDGPDGVMPRPYSFWCPPELFPGTLDEEAFDTEALLLLPSGLGIADFGDDPDATIATIEGYLGRPDEDTGWIASFSTWGTCPGGQIRVVRWDDLEVLFTDAPETSGAYPAPGVPHFFNWRTPDLFSIGDPIGLSTPEGIGIGSTVAQLSAVYGASIEIFFDDVFEFWFLRIGPPGGITGSVSGDQPGDVVLFLEAGGLCGE